MAPRIAFNEGFLFLLTVYKICLFYETKYIINGCARKYFIAKTARRPKAYSPKNLGCRGARHSPERPPSR